MDALRGLATVAVVVIHLSTPVLHASDPGSGMSWLSLGLNQAARFAVPAFVFLSGMGLSLSGADRPGNASIGRRAAKLLPLYVLWSVIYSAAGSALQGKPFTPVTVARDLLTGGAWYHLYFVPMLLLLTLAFPLLGPWLRTRRGVLSAFAVTLAAVALRYHHLVPSGAFFLVKSVSPLPWVFYFAAGAALAPRLPRFRALCVRNRGSLAVLCLAGIGLLALDVWVSGAAAGNPLDERITQVRPAVLPYALAVFAWAFSVAWTGGFGRFLLRLQGPSYGIYLAHPLVIEALRQAAPFHVGGNVGAGIHLLALPVVLAASWLLGSATAWLVRPVSAAFSAASPSRG